MEGKVIYDGLQDSDERGGIKVSFSMQDNFIFKAALWKNW